MTWTALKRERECDGPGCSSCSSFFFKSVRESACHTTVAPFLYTMYKCNVNLFPRPSYHTFSVFTHWLLFSAHCFSLSLSSYFFSLFLHPFYCSVMHIVSQCFPAWIPYSHISLTCSLTRFRQRWAARRPYWYMLTPTSCTLD